MRERKRVDLCFMHIHKRERTQLIPEVAFLSLYANAIRTEEYHTFLEVFAKKILIIMFFNLRQKKCYTSMYCLLTPIQSSVLATLSRNMHRPAIIFRNIKPFFLNNVFVKKSSSDPRHHP